MCLCVPCGAHSLCRAWICFCSRHNGRGAARITKAAPLSWLKNRIEPGQSGRTRRGAYVIGQCGQAARGTRDWTRMQFETANWQLARLGTEGRPPGPQDTLGKATGCATTTTTTTQIQSLECALLAIVFSRGSILSAIVSFIIILTNGLSD